MCIPVPVQGESHRISRARIPVFIFAAPYDKTTTTTTTDPKHGNNQPVIHNNNNNNNNNTQHQ
jgi:hypothetical protein